MTPERRQEIALRAAYCANNYRLHEPRTLGNDVIDLLATLDALTAENERLKSMLSGRTMSCECCNTTSAENATLKAQVEHYKLQSDQLCDRVESLSTKLDALVTAVRKVNESKVTEVVDNGECAADGEPLMDETGDYIVDANDWDALASACAKAKGVVE